MGDTNVEVQCYNRGCGQKYKPATNDNGEFLRLGFLHKTPNKLYAGLFSLQTSSEFSKRMSSILVPGRFSIVSGQNILISLLRLADIFGVYLDSCRHHPGEPFFHDAYKGWTCCNKKCTDFTEFLNIKGCTVSKHSNIKPPEPVKPAVKDELDQEIVEVKPLVPSTLKRPSLNAPMVTKE